MDYTSLSAAISTWATRTYSQAQTDEFIQLAESAFNRRLQGYQRETTTTLTADTNGDIALPADFLGMRSVYDGDDAYTYNISGSTLNVIDGESRGFTVTYYAKLLPLSATNTSNWLLAAAPDAYLFMCKAQQRAFEEEFQTAAGFEGKALAIIDELSMQNTVAQYGRMSLRVPGATP